MPAPPVTSAYLATQLGSFTTTTAATTAAAPAAARAVTTLHPNTAPGGVSHCHPHCHLAKFRDLMIKGKHGAVIG
jgi:hypothetical protein